MTWTLEQIKQAIWDVMYDNSHVISAAILDHTEWTLTQIWPLIEDHLKGEEKE